MVDYLPAIVSLTAGVLAFFFAKTGERNKVGGVGWAMAALLVGGGLLGLYVLADKQVKAEISKREAVAAADRAAIAAAKQSALVMTLVGDFDLKQTIPQITLIFEFPYMNDSEPKTAEGFVGPFPALPDGVVGGFALQIADVASTDVLFQTSGVGRIRLTDTTAHATYDLTRDAIVRNGAPSEDVLGWAAGPEPAPSGFVYSLTVPVDKQLRRLLYAIVAQEPLGHVRFPKGRFSAAELETMHRSFEANPPMLVFSIAESERGEACNSYVHIPLRLVRAERPIIAEEREFDGFELRLTPVGFAPDPCNSNPF